MFATGLWIIAEIALCILLHRLKRRSVYTLTWWHSTNHLGPLVKSGSHCSLPSLHGAFAQLWIGQLILNKGNVFVLCLLVALQYSRIWVCLPISKAGCKLLDFLELSSSCMREQHASGQQRSQLQRPDVQGYTLAKVSSRFLLARFPWVYVCQQTCNMVSLDK